MKNQKLIAVVCGVLLCLLMIASDYYGFTKEKSVVKFKGEFFEKSFKPSWWSFIVPLSIILIGLFQKQNPKS